MNEAAIAHCKESIAHHSKSFSLASKLLPRGVREDVWVLYHWCRRADDAIDLAPPREQPAALAQLRAELEALYGGGQLPHPALQAMREVVHRYGIPRAYPEELLAGLEMDMREMRYESMEELMLYCYRVAGVVGLMMSHVMGVSHGDALRHATHLGMAMQLTNICRDVHEDWERGRIYLPEQLFDPASMAHLRSHLGRPLPRNHQAEIARAVEQLLSLADAYYASGDAGMRYLSRRCRLAVRTARLVYSAIGAEIRARHCNIFAGRAHTTKRRKLRLAARALGATTLETLRGGDAAFARAEVRHVVRYPGDVLLWADGSNGTFAGCSNRSSQYVA